jgi:hypothetical protein
VSDPTNNHPAFDPAEADILSKLVPDGPDANEPLDGLPTGTDAPADTAAPAAAADTAAPAASVAEAGAPAAPAAAADASTAAAGNADATAAPAAPAPQGDTRAALRASRHAERRLRDENQRLADENAALKKANPAVDTRITDEELEQLEQDFPLQAKIVRNQRVLEERLAQQATAPAEATQDFEPLYYDPVIQVVIDEVPLLLDWQNDATKQDHFLKAIDYDKSLNLDPDWKDRPAVERFAEAARRAESALAPAPKPTPSAATNAATAAPAATRLDPKAVIDGAPVDGPKGISDFRGGAPASTTATPNYAGKTDEEIMASLPVQS